MREIEEIAMPMTEQHSIAHPERVFLRWKDVSTRIDIGQLCYLKRDTTSKSRSQQCIDFESFSIARIKVVRRLIETLSEIQLLKSYRPFTVAQHARFLIVFMNWVDRQGSSLTLTDENETEKFVRQYFRELRELVSRNQKNRNYASSIQRSILMIFKIYFENDTFGSAIQTIRYCASRNTPTEVPDDEWQGRRFSVASALFSKISDVILKFKPYPFEVSLGPTESVWLFPTRARKSPGNGEDVLAWNLNTGELQSLEYVKKKSESLNDAYSSAWSTLKNAKSHLLEANENPQAFIRKSHAVTATLAFALLFGAETGINPSQLANIGWSTELSKQINSAGVTRQKFREIKFRAAGKKISIELSIEFMPKLKQYLMLREYVLGKVKCSKLLVVLDIKGHPQGIKTNFMRLFNSRVSSLRISLPHVTSRQWRAAKQDNVLRREGPIVAARVMNHTLATALKAYSNGTHAAHLEEMGTYLSTVEKTIVRDRKRRGLGSSVGACVEFHMPKPITQEIPIQPNCSSSEGCLFCDKYRAHADSIDIRKLLSCRYCIRITSNRAKSMEEYDKTFGAVLRRIDFLLLEISKYQKALVKEIENDVDAAGNLDQFWARKLELLFELELA